MSRISALFLKAQEHIGLPQPNLSARLYKNSPEEFVRQCVRVIAKGSGMPQCFNDEAIIPALKNQGISDADARDYAIVGCVELTTHGNNLGWSDAAVFNLTKVLEFTLNNGICVLRKEDLLIADMKVFDPQKHLLYTGKNNELIKENFRFLDTKIRSGETLPQILVRITMIPGYTATEENIRSVAEFVHALSPKIQMELLNYNPLAKSKYNLLNQPYLIAKNPQMYPPEEMDRFYRILAEAGMINVVHG